MHKLLHFKYDKQLIGIILCFIIISLLSIYSAETLLSNGSNFFIKQILWYTFGIILVFGIILIGNDLFYKYSLYLYIIGNVLLLLLLIFGVPINDAKCWFTIPYIGSFQPSEFMKIILILFLAKLIHKFNEKTINPSVKEEFIFLIKIICIVAIPSILTFLEPDTGNVLIYLLITIVMLFLSGIRLRWFLILIVILLACIGIILGIYFLNRDLFINLLGTDFFLRVDRLLDWSNKSGYQLENGLTAIGSAGIFGHGFNHTPIYFPEPQTDFIFAVFASNFGLMGAIILLIIIGLFDIKLVFLAKEKPNIEKYILAGSLGMLMYQQVQNIGMTLGLMPITGITLPFISYGGSSLLSYMIIIGIIFNIAEKK